MEDQLEEEANKAQEKEADRQIRSQMLAALSQLNQRLEKVEGQQSAASSGAGSFIPVGPSPTGQVGP